MLHTSGIWISLFKHCFIPDSGLLDIVDRDRSALGIVFVQLAIVGIAIPNPDQLLA